MKAKEIIEELQKVDPETEVTFEMADGCCGDTEFLDAVDIDVDIKDGKFYKEDCARIFFSAPWFLDSCRKSGAAHRAAQTIIDSHKKWQEEQKKKREDDVE